MPDFSQLGADTWMSLIYITVFASCVALGLQNAAVARVDPAQAALFLATESVFGVTFSILLLGEAPAISAYLGFALIFVGIVVSEYLPCALKRSQPKKQGRQPKPPPSIANKSKPRQPTSKRPMRSCASYSRPSQQ